jgi:hypothetical protein
MIKEKMSKTIMEILSITKTLSVIIQMYIKSSSIFPWSAREPTPQTVPKLCTLLQVPYNEILFHPPSKRRKAYITECPETLYTFTNFLQWNPLPSSFEAPGSLHHRVFRNFVYFHKFLTMKYSFILFWSSGESTSQSDPKLCILSQVPYNEILFHPILKRRVAYITKCSETLYTFKSFLKRNHLLLKR